MPSVSLTSALMRSGVFLTSRLMNNGRRSAAVPPLHGLP